MRLMIVPTPEGIVIVRRVERRALGQIWRRNHDGSWDRFDRGDWVNSNSIYMPRELYAARGLARAERME
jgi:hypothetical protein